MAMCSMLEQGQNQDHVCAGPRGVRAPRKHDRGDRRRVQRAHRIMRGVRCRLERHVTSVPEWIRCRRCRLVSQHIERGDVLRRCAQRRRRG
jgi:hypothetical protein